MLEWQWKKEWWQWVMEVAIGDGGGNGWWRWQWVMEVAMGDGGGVGEEAPA